MTVRDDLLRELRSAPEGLSDSELTIRLGRNHQQINLICRTLAADGMIIRDDSFRPIRNRLVDDAPTAPEPRLRKPESSAEADVQASMVRYLAAEGWSIRSVADTARRERGVDIVAERGERRLLVEVKGWPSDTYVRGERAGEPKPTQPSTQAAVWFAGGLLELLRPGGTEPEAELALALPDRSRYRKLLDDVRWAMRRLDITVFLVDDRGEVARTSSP